MFKRADWHKVRSSHADVLESLEAVIRRHPANPRPRAELAPEPIDHDTPGAVILEFRARRPFANSNTDGAA